MKEEAKYLQVDFSTADAEYPEIIQEDGDVVLRFNDWKDNIIEVFFAESMALKWQIAEIFHEGERPDACYEIENSEWLNLHISQGEASKEEGFKHYKFNFNGCGQFEILATGFTKRT